MTLRRPLTIPQNAHPLVKRLYRAMNQQQISPREVEKRAGIGKMVINEWRRNARKPDIDCITAALNVVGLRVCVRETDFDEDGTEFVPVKASVAEPVRDERFEVVC